MGLFYQNFLLKKLGILIVQATNLKHIVTLLAYAYTLDMGRNKKFKERWEET
jgi:hypothetical protein